MREVQKRGGLACYGVLGADIAAGHHEETFDPDEGVLLPGVKLLFSLVQKTREAWKKS